MTSDEETLRAELEKLIKRWRELGDIHGVRQFTGNDHKLFANEVDTVLKRTQTRTQTSR